MNQRRWGLPLGGIKSSLEIVCFQVAPERVKCIDERIESGREFQTTGPMGSAPIGAGGT